MLLFSFIVVASLIGTGNSSFVEWEDNDYAAARKEIIAWWRKEGPQPNLQCSEAHHLAAVNEKTQKLNMQQGGELLVRLQNLFLRADDKPFVGLNETLLSLRSGMADLIVITERKYISVYDFRNPSTGHHLYEFCDGPDCISKNEIQDGTDYGTYFLVGCLPFPSFVHKHYRKNGPIIASLVSSSDFFRSVSEIGGFFRTNFKMHSAPLPRAQRSRHARKYLMVIRHH